MMKALKAQSKAGAASRLARMSKYAKGGKVSDGDADDKPTAKAKKAAPMSVDGKPTRARLDRPGRKMGRKGFEPGGEVKDASPPNPGEINDAASAEYLGDKARGHMGSTLANMAGAQALAGSGIGAGLATKKIPQQGGKNFASAVGGLLISAAVPRALRSYDELKESMKANREAKEFIKSGRKDGGRAKR